MSFFDDASLAFLPSGAAGKDGKAYSIKPTNGDGDFTFSRGSNLSATRVGADGLIEKGRENLFLQSNQFDSVSWSGLSKTSGILGYDGTNDAWEITKPAQPYTPISQSVSATGVWTFSLYAKANTLDEISIRNQTDGEKADIDLLNGLITYTSSGIVHSDIELISNDWYRLQITFSGSTAQIAIYIAWNNSTAGSVYIQDAQIELGLVATPYIESGATTGKAGLLEDEPRFDYSGGVTCPSLLLEPSRTQLIPQSEYLEGVFADLGVNSIVINYRTSPEGLVNSTRLEGVSLTGGQYFESFGTSLTDGTTYTFSCYYKGTAGEKTAIRGLGSGGSGTSVDKLITFTGDWQREDVTFVAGSTNNYAYITDQRVSGTTASNFEVWGAQLEEGSYPTSYIPNHSGGTITRGKDSCKNTTITDFQTSDATLFFEFNYDSSRTGNFRYVFSTENSTSSNFDLITLNSTSGGTSFSFGMSGSGISFSTLSLLSGANKAIIKFERSTGAVKTFLNGAAVDSATATSIPEIHKIALGGRLNAYSGFATDRELGDVVKQALVFPEALSDADCITLTTI